MEDGHTPLATSDRALAGRFVWYMFALIGLPVVMVLATIVRPGALELSTQLMRLPPRVLNPLLRVAPRVLRVLNPVLKLPVLPTTLPWAIAGLAKAANATTITISTATNLVIKCATYSAGRMEGVFVFEDQVAVCVAGCGDVSFSEGIGFELHEYRKTCRHTIVWFSCLKKDPAC
jgi:hypothetical protein